MSKGVVVVVVGLGAAALLLGVKFALADDASKLSGPRDLLPPPPPPTLNQTIYAAGATAATIGVNAYTAIVGSRPTTKDVALTVATGGIYPQAKAAVNWVKKIF